MYRIKNEFLEIFADFLDIIQEFLTFNYSFRFFLKDFVLKWEFLANIDAMTIYLFNKKMPLIVHALLT